MDYEQLLALIPLATSSAEQAGRAFFLPETKSEERRKLLKTLLELERYEQICELIHCGRISKLYSSADYLSQEQSERLTLEARYFDLFIEEATACGLNDSDYMPMVFSAYLAPHDTVLYAWSEAVEAFLLKRAFKDYDAIAKYIFDYDKKLRYANILIMVNRTKTIETFTDMALFGKGYGKAHIRKFLREYKTDVAAAVKKVYETGKLPAREASVRLLLLYKNDVVVREFLDEIVQSEKSERIKKLIIGGTGKKSKTKISEKTEDIFYRAMILGTAIPLAEFKQNLSDEKYATVASHLFFSIYLGAMFHDIVIVDNGEILNLNNEPTNLPTESIVRVLHPVELTNKFAYLKQLKIAQPFLQIKRTVYLPDEVDKNYNCCSRLEGTLIDAQKLKNNLKTCAFKLLNRDIEGYSTQIGIVRDNILCVLDVSPTDFRSPEHKLVTVGRVRFYNASNAIHLNGNTYVDGVPVVPVMTLSIRAFSEFLYSVYELLNCNSVGGVR